MLESLQKELPTTFRVTGSRAWVLPVRFAKAADYKARRDH